jgi:AhpD family alkylhydroperoxidase
MPGENMREQPKQNTASPEFAKFFEGAHSAGVLDQKTKMLMHLAVALALKCEPCVVYTFENLKRAGASEAEIYETIQLAGSVGAGAILSMGDRAKSAAEAGHHWWVAPAVVGV